MCAYWFSEEEKSKLSKDNCNRGEDDDNFFGDDSSASEMKVDERYHEKSLQDLRKSGYRDAIQAHMNDEPLIQRAFNYAFALNAKIAYVFGFLRALVEMNASAQHSKQNLLQKLDSIECELVNECNYKNLIQLHDDVNLSLMNEDALHVHLQSIIQRLTQFKDEAEFASNETLNQLIDELMSIKMFNI